MAYNVSTTGEVVKKLRDLVGSGKLSEEYLKEGQTIIRDFSKAIQVFVTSKKPDQDTYQTFRKALSRAKRFIEQAETLEEEAA